MSHLMEVLITSDSDNTLWTCCAWDPRTGTALTSWRGGGSAQPRTLGLIAGDYIAAAERGKPLLQVWPLNSQQTVQGLRFVLPGRANAFAFSPDGNYCIAGVAEKIYLWQIASGSLLTIINRHYQPITALQFTTDGRWFVSAAEDGMVMVWSLATVAAHPEVELATQSTAGRHDPAHVFSDHSLPVTDLALSKTGMHGRLATVSGDRTCKIYDLTTGDMLLNLVFDVPLLSVTFDVLELNLFVGTSEGKILKISLTHPPRSREHYINDDSSAEAFTGHSKGVTCLSVSLDGETLASGSNDEQVILWHISSRQHIRTMRHKGPVTNVFFTLNPRVMHLQEFSPSIVLHSLERTLEKDSESALELEILTKTTTDFWPKVENTSAASSHYLAEEFNERETKLKEEIKTLKNINAKLYEYAAEKIVDGPAAVNTVNTPNKKRKTIRQ